jgi:hypothetical protein
MFGFMGILFPRHSRNFNQYKAFIHKNDIAGAKQFLKSLDGNEMSKLINEVISMAVDELEQNLFSDMRKEIEDKSYPITFSDN